MANYSYQSIGYAGTDVTFTAPTGGALADSIPTDPRGFFWVKNAAAGGTITVTVHVPGTLYGVISPPPAVVVSIPDGEERMIGPMVEGLGNPAFLGVVAMSIAPNVTGVTAAAVKVP